MLDEPCHARRHPWPEERCPLVTMMAIGILRHMRKELTDVVQKRGDGHLVVGACAPCECGALQRVLELGHRLAVAFAAARREQRDHVDTTHEHLTRDD